MAMAKRCNSPPERRSTSRSQTCLSSGTRLATFVNITLPERTQSLCNLIQSCLVDLRSCGDLMTNTPVSPLDSLWDLVHVLRLGNSLEVILQDLGEVVCLCISRCSHFICVFPLLCSSDPLKYFKTSSQSGGSSYLPKLGFNLPAKIFNAVLFPIPFVPTRPNTWPGLGIGSLCSLKLLAL